MARPVVHKTAEAKLQASCERHRHHYAKDEILKRRRVLRSSKTKESKEAKKFHKELLKAVAKAPRRRDDNESESESESDSDDDSESEDDENIKLDDLPECLRVVKDIKDEMLAMIGDDPCKFVEGVFCDYVKSFPEDSSPGDISIIESSIAKVQKILNRAIPAQDQILNFCGVSPGSEWHAADSVTRFLRTVLAYLEDIEGLIFLGGVCELTLAHSMGEMMYQKGLRI
ncbi:hypothetical protein DEU56DRAFT_918281 [Suillus clintonianus]|uniref:uncharacterized protein n=1 Tax=Suillus clintonianus TaxID=1904413 RepID=UPI001B87139A|nr:uncharacterized protein DEU56DRAFT_918281 [Suillus clintonianus]KAG2121279.1 hypothetical protein DEU56DRAFT_918281 [Suillus clintonianus]